METLLDGFHILGCSMSIIVHFSNNHLNEFPANLEDMSDENGERFHQDGYGGEIPKPMGHTNDGRLLSEYSNRLCRHETLQTLS